LSTGWADRIETHNYEGDEDNEEEAAKKDENQPLALYMTMHKSKGLQADYVCGTGE
jgi:ATP-dependent exoDNAse (exonuclease V) beta subunit